MPAIMQASLLLLSTSFMIGQKGVIYDIQCDLYLSTSWFFFSGNKEILPAFMVECLFLFNNSIILVN